MTPRRRALVLALTTVTCIVLVASPASADNCSGLRDCYNTLRAAIAAAGALGILFGTILSMGLDFIPGVGTAKGVYEAFTGEDLVTGEKLAWWERALGVIPFVGGLASFGALARAADAIGDAARAADRAGDLAGAARATDRAGDAAGAARGADRAADAARRADDAADARRAADRGAAGRRGDDAAGAARRGDDAAGTARRGDDAADAPRREDGAAGSTRQGDAAGTARGDAAAAGTARGGDDAASAARRGDDASGTAAAGRSEPAPSAPARTGRADPSALDEIERRGGSRAADDIHKAPEGSEIPMNRLEDMGIPRANFDAIQRVARDRNVNIDVRPTNPYSVPHLHEGAHPKSPDLKSKTIDDVDTHPLIGYRRQDRGLVGYREPAHKGTLTDADRPAGMSDADWNAVTKRHAQRTAEFRDQSAKMQENAKKGITVDEHGVVHHPDGKPYAGDHDIFQVTDRNGNPLTPEASRSVTDQLQRETASVQHPAHVDWGPSPTDKTNWDIDQKIRTGHMPTGGESLVRIGPKGPPTTARYHPEKYENRSSGRTLDSGDGSGSTASKNTAAGEPPSTEPKADGDGDG